jgi:hypothetical protein
MGVRAVSRKPSLGARAKAPTVHYTYTTNGVYIREVKLPGRDRAPCWQLCPSSWGKREALPGFEPGLQEFECKGVLDDLHQNLE